MLFSQRAFMSLIENNPRSRATYSTKIDTWFFRVSREESKSVTTIRLGLRLSRRHLLKTMTNRTGDFYDGFDGLRDLAHGSYAPKVCWCGVVGFPIRWSRACSFLLLCARIAADERLDSSNPCFAEYFINSECANCCTLQRDFFKAKVISVQ